MTTEQSNLDKQLTEIKQEIQRYRDHSDARVLILAGLSVLFLGTFIPDETFAGKVAEKTADVISIGLNVGGLLRLAGVNITDTGRRVINNVRRQK